MGYVFKTQFMKEKRYYNIILLISHTMYLWIWLFTSYIRSAKRRAPWIYVLKILSVGLTLLALKLVEALLVALGERIGSALCAYEDHVHDHLRILSNKSVDIFPLIAIYIGLNPTIATKDFVKQVDCLTLDFSVSFRCIVSCLSLILSSTCNHTCACNSEE